MVWFLVDDKMHHHPKMLAAGNAAVGLWVRCGSYSTDALTNGFIPTQLATMYGSRKEIAALLASGLWTQVEGGYQMHDFTDWNRNADAVRAERAEKHEAKVRAGRAGGQASGKARAKQTGSRNEAYDQPEPEQNEALYLHQYQYHSIESPYEQTLPDAAASSVGPSSTVIRTALAWYAAAVYTRDPSACKGGLLGREPYEAGISRNTWQKHSARLTAYIDTHPMATVRNVAEDVLGVTEAELLKLKLIEPESLDERIARRKREREAADGAA